MKKITYFILFISISLCSQNIPSPSGVRGLQLWLKAGAVSENLQNDYRFQDFSGDSVKVRYYDGKVLADEIYYDKRQVRSFNFNPSIYLDIEGFAKLTSSNLSQACVIGVFTANAENTDNDNFLYGLYGRAGQGVVISTDKLIHSSTSGKTALDYGEAEGHDFRFSSGDPEKNQEIFNEGALRVGSYLRSTRPNKRIWGEPQKAILQLGGRYNQSALLNQSGFDTSLFDNRLLKGFCPELIIYNRVLTPLERVKVETYLGIKYGISLYRSYIDSQGRLLWDYAANATYNHRITGVFRDDVGALYQAMSTTSYEEAPNQTNYKTFGFDSFDDDNFYNKPSRHRLLVMGKAEANALPNQSYLLWGDNDQTLQTAPLEHHLGMQVMARRWKVQTNFNDQPLTDQSTIFNYKGLTASLEGYTVRLNQVKDFNGTPTAISQNPLNGKAGYVSWVYQRQSVDIVVKFGTSTPDVATGDYGYYINQRGNIYPISNGKVDYNNRIDRISEGTKIEVYKTATELRLQLSGIGRYDYNIPIKATDVSKSFYAGLLFYNIDEAFGIKGLRHGGFIDTGNTVELSYTIEANKAFEPYKDGKVYMLIDRSGTGKFLPEDVTLIKSDETDKRRGKVIFNNVLWDTDNNTTDVFTFGYYTSDFLVEVNPVSPDCVNGVEQQNGSIEVKIKQGHPVYGYDLYLKQDKDSTLLKTSTKGYLDSFTIDSLHSGTYTLLVKQAGGIDFVAQRESKANTVGMTFDTGSISWHQHQQPESPYKIGYNTVFFGDVRYGVKVDGTKLYTITNDEVSTEPVYTIKNGDYITVKRDYERILVYVNQKELSQINLIPIHRLLGLHGKFDFLGKVSVKNVKVEDFHLDNLIRYDDDAIEAVKRESMTQVATLTITSDCTGNKPADVAEESYDNTNALTVGQAFLEDYTRFNVSVTIDKPGAAELLVSHINGTLVHRQMMQGYDTTKTATFNLRYTGVYIIKVLTQDREYSRKIMAQ